MKKLKFGILGATRGINFVLGKLSGHPDAEVTAICESYAPQLNRVSEELRKLGISIEAFTDFEEFLKSDIDAVVIANFANDHARFAIKALLSGKHVLSEVMPSQTLAEAVALCEAVEKSGKIYHYAENYCFFGAILEMRLRYERGDIGELVLAEGDFINDCSQKWHMLTRGVRNHWRNLVPSTFYCTHSIGPMFAISGERAVSVVGMEAPCLPYMSEHGARSGSAAMEIMKLGGGAMARSINGNYKHPYSCHCRMIGTEGSMSTDGHYKLQMNFGQSGNCYFKTEEYKPETLRIPGADALEVPASDDGLDFLLRFFIAAINGDKVLGKYGIDVYRALDMSLPGLLAYRSILAGSAPVKVPDFRDESQREAFRHDHSCTDPAVAGGEQLLPSCAGDNIEIPDEVYANEARKYREETEASFRLGNY